MVVDFQLVLMKKGVNGNEGFSLTHPSEALVHKGLGVSVNGVNVIPKTLENPR